MVPNVWRGDAWEVSANGGETHIVPADAVGASAVPSDGDLDPFVEGRIDRDEDGAPIVTLRSGVWFAQLSAPGYLDQTDLAIFDTEREALEYLVDTYDDLDDDDDDRA
jgi:hypothetical protein